MTLLMQSDLADLVWTIADRIGTGLGLDDCVVYLREGDVLAQHAAFGEKKFGERDILHRIEIAVGQGIVGTVASTGVAEIVGDTRSDPRYIWDQVGGRSELAVPIRFEGEVIGVIDSESTRPNAYDDAMLELLQSLANIAAPRIASELGKLKLADADAELRRSEQELAGILEAVSEGIMTVDPHGVIHNFNASAEAMFGYSRDDVVGKDFRLLMPPDRAARYRNRVVEYLAEGEGVMTGLESWARRRDGSLFPMETNLSSMVGELSLVVCSMRDITDRKAAEAALQYRLGFEALVSEVSSSFINLNAQEVDHGIDRALARVAEFLRADNAYIFRFFDDQRLFSCTHKWNSALSRRVLTGEHKFATSHYTWWMSRLARGETIALDSLDELPPTAAAEREILRTVGVQSIIEVPMMHQGVVTGYLGVSLSREQREWSGDDVSLLQLLGQIFTNALKRKENEEELVRSREDARAASRAKSQFLANMSHELRTPLNAIIGYSELLRLEADPDTQQGLIDDLNSIHQSGSHLLSLITDVLDLAKIESGRTELEYQWFSLAELAADVARTAAPLMKENHNQLDVKCDQDVGTMQGDKTRVRQILLNLLSNAAKFTENGDVTLRVTRVVARGNRMLRFAVTDSGIGIPTDKLEQIFTEFVQADPSTTREFGGTGLGLPISRKLCDLMGGEIEVESEPGVGSTFVVTLPQSTGEGLRVAQPGVSSRSGAR